jgi:hypothetical protein
MLISSIYFLTIRGLGKLRVNKFYEVVGLDILMHTMSDQLGDGGDFDRNSRDHSYQDNLNNHLRMQKEGQNVKILEYQNELLMMQAKSN